jgi:hypothetical protein
VEFKRDFERSKDHNNTTPSEFSKEGQYLKATEYREQLDFLTVI